MRSVHGSLDHRQVHWVCRCERPVRRKHPVRRSLAVSVAPNVVGRLAAGSVTAAKLRVGLRGCWLSRCVCVPPSGRLAVRVRAVQTTAYTAAKKASACVVADSVRCIAVSMSSSNTRAISLWLFVVALRHSSSHEQDAQRQRQQQQQHVRCGDLMSRDRSQQATCLFTAARLPHRQLRQCDSM